MNLCFVLYQRLKEVRHRRQRSLSADIEDLLLSNFPPNELEEVLVHDSLKKAIKETQRLDSLIRSRRADPENSKLATDRQAQERLVQACRKILSPVRRLPSEVLCEIFDWYAFLHREIFCELRVVKPRYIPWALSHVCQRWRANALSVQSLWQCLPTVDLLGQSFMDLPRFYAMFEELLLRTGKKPLTVGIRAPAADTNLPYPLLELLMSHSERWETVTIEAIDQLEARMRKIQKRLTALSKLKLVFCGYLSSAHIIDIFSEAPLLQEITVLGEYEGGLIFSSRNLLRYRFEIEKCSAQLTYSPNALRDLIIVDRANSTCCQTNSLMTFPSVTKFDYTSSLSPTHSSILRVIVLPALEELHFNAHFFEAISTIQSIILRAQTPSLLRILKLHNVTYFESRCRLADLLKYTPQLTELQTLIPPLNDLVALAYGYLGQMLVPQLELCTLSSFTPIDTRSGTALRDIGISRCDQEGPKSRLKRFFIVGPSYTSLTFRDIHIRVQHSPFFERWPNFPSIVAKDLEYLRSKLFGAFSTPPTDAYSEICNILHEIADVQITDFRDILIADLPNMLNQIEFSLKLVPRTGAFSAIYQHIDEIRTNWKRALSKLPQDQFQDIHWAYEKESFDCLYYISKNHAIRTSNRRFIRSIIYGF